MRDQTDTKQFLKALNSVLAVVFLASLAGFLSPGITGNFSATSSKQKKCSYVSGNINTSISVDRCCIEAEKALSCNSSDNGTFCHTGKQGYVLNHEAVAYCRSKGAGLE
ncbi:MAG: hypothetical protein ABEJ87_01945 [Candidatus Nanohalobium sp.]